MAKKSDDVTALSFVRNATKEEQEIHGRQPRIFWSVKLTGDFTADCNTGAELAREAVAFMERHSMSYLLTWIVTDMMQVGRNWSGIETGFLSQMGRDAIVAQMVRRLADEKKVA